MVRTTNRDSGHFILPSDYPFQPTADVRGAFEASGAFWGLQREPVYAHPTVLGLEGFQGTPQVIPGARALLRSDTLESVGLVSEGYEPFSNLQVADLVQAMIVASPEPVLVDSVVTYAGGSGLIVGLRGGTYRIGGEGDRMAHRLYLHTRHDGRGGLTVFPMQTRLACSNQVPFRAGSGANLRHSTGIEDKAAALTRIMSKTWDLAMDFQSIGNTLSDAPISERDAGDLVNAYLERAYPMPTYTTGPVEAHNARCRRIVTKRREEWEEIIFRFQSSPAMTSLAYSRWRLYNAITEQEEHSPSRGDHSKARTLSDSSRNQRKLLGLEVVQS